MPTESVTPAPESAAFRLAAARRVLGYPDAAGLRALADVLALVQTEETDPRLRSLASRLAADLPDLAGRGELAQEEYTRLFISDLPRPCCPPLESFYREGTRVGAPTSEMAALLAAEGLAPLLLPPDHLLAELALAQHLIDPARAGGLGRLVRGRAVLRRHTLGWLPIWVGDVTRAAHHPFFVHAAAFTLRACRLAGARRTGRRRLRRAQSGAARPTG